MVGKLLKYELKILFKSIVLLYAFCMAASISAKILFALSDALNSSTCLVLGYISLFAFLILSITVIIFNFSQLWKRFRDNLYADEAYLTHTLPVSKHSIYLSKLLSAIITVFTSCLLILISLLINSHKSTFIEDIRMTLLIFINMFNFTSSNLSIVTLITLVLEIILLIQIGYTGIIIGHKFNHNKTAKSVLFGFVDYMIVQITFLILTSIFEIIDNKTYDILNNTSDNVPQNAFMLLSYVSMFFYIIMVVAHYIFDYKLLKKGVNID